MVTELKPCPFCGGRPLPGRSFSERRYSFYAFVQCSKCGIRGRSFRTDSDPLEGWIENPAAQMAVTAWNTRGGRLDTEGAKARETGV